MISKDVVIIGTGFSGLGMAVKLLESGRDDFVVLEKADDVGGTWRDNTYPGCECDIPSHMYSFSYDLNPTWSRSYSPQPEIWDYLRGVTDRRVLRPWIDFGVEVTGAAWDESRQRWTVQTAGGQAYEARVVVSGIGALHIPRLPDIAGSETFAGPAFHSAQWRHDIDLTGKHVAVIGTGASAIQFIPVIAGQVAQLDVYQRTAPWVIPKNDKCVEGWKKSLLDKVPGALRAYRNGVYWTLESTAFAFTGRFKGIGKLVEKQVRSYVEKTVDDPETARKLIPDYRFGCKRVLKSNTYIETYNRDNVDLIDTGIAEITAAGVVDRDGVLHKADVIIYGTGFHVIEAIEHLSYTGREGRDLGREFTEKGVETSLGINVNGYPNLFFLLGPNTALGHNSVVFMIEQQAKYVVRCLDEMDARGAVALEPAPQAQREFNNVIQRKLAEGIWTQGGCTSWYLDAQGVNRTIWPGFTFTYWWETRTVRDEDYTWETAKKEKEKEEKETTAA